MRGRKQKRTGYETRSTFDKSPELEISLLDLQRHYIKTRGNKPTMRDLLIEGISTLLEREGLPAIQVAHPVLSPSVISIATKAGA